MIIYTNATKPKLDKTAVTNKYNPIAIPFSVQEYYEKFEDTSKWFKDSEFLDDLFDFKRPLPYHLGQWSDYRIETYLHLNNEIVEGEIPNPIPREMLYYLPAVISDDVCPYIVYPELNLYPINGKLPNIGQEIELPIFSTSKYQQIHKTKILKVAGSLEELSSCYVVSTIHRSITRSNGTEIKSTLNVLHYIKNEEGTYTPAVYVQQITDEEYQSFNRRTRFQLKRDANGVITFVRVTVR